MRKIITTGIICAFLLNFFFLNTTFANTDNDKNEKPKADSDQFKSEVDKISYSVGANFFLTFINIKNELEAVGYQFNDELILKGFEDAVKQKTIISSEKAQSIVNDFKRESNAKLRSRDTDLANANRDKADKFLAENAKKSDVVKLKSGLQYVILKNAEGAKPALTDQVKVNYKGALIDGTEFDSSYKRNKPAIFMLNRVIKGWKEGIQLMTVGSKYRFFIPPQLGYSNKRIPNIPLNSLLIFDVELLEIAKNSPTPKNQLR